MTAKSKYPASKAVTCGDLQPHRLRPLGGGLQSRDLVVSPLFCVACGVELDHIHAFDHARVDLTRIGIDKQAHPHTGGAKFTDKLNDLCAMRDHV